MNISRIDEFIKRQEGLSSLGRADIEKMQLEKLNKVLKKEKIRQGFYKDLPEKLDSLDELQTLPFTDSEQLREYGFSMLVLSQSEIERVTTEQTSGTTGRAKRMFYTAGDLENTVQLFMAGLGEFIFPGSVTYIAMPFSGPGGLGELIAEAVRRLGAEPLKAGPFLSLGEIKKILEEKKPDTFVGLPETLIFMLRSLGRMSLRRALISGDACPDSLTEACEKILGHRLFPHYGSREIALGGAICCPAHEGMHLRENHVIAEIVDENGSRLPEGEYGELVITTIGMEAMPLIRYRTGDITRIFPGKCPCGSEVIRLDKLKRLAAPEILELDEKIFALDSICDYRADKQENKIHLDCLVKKELSDKDILSAAAEALPGFEFTADCEIITPQSKPLYAGKRKLN